MQSSHWCEGLVALECNRGYRRWAKEEGVKVLIWRDRAVLFLIKKVVWVLAVITCLSTGILRNKTYFRTCCFRWADLAWWKLRVAILYKNQSYAPDTCTPNCAPNLLLTAVGMIKLAMKTCPVSRLMYLYEYPQKACNSQISWFHIALYLEKKFSHKSQSLMASAYSELCFSIYICCFDLQNCKSFHSKNLIV